MYNIAKQRIDLETFINTCAHYVLMHPEVTEVICHPSVLVKLCLNKNYANDISIHY